MVGEHDDHRGARTFAKESLGGFEDERVQIAKLAYHRAVAFGIPKFLPHGAILRDAVETVTRRPIGIEHDGRVWGHQVREDKLRLIQTSGRPSFQRCQGSANSFSLLLVEPLILET